MAGIVLSFLACGFIALAGKRGSAPTMVLSRAAVGLALVRAAHPGVNETTTAYIGVTDVTGLHDHCQRHGAPVVMPLTDHPWGLRDFVVEIPGGHRLALGERVSAP